ncbi:unnamed protein product, partial [Heterosigma akashiwo]
MDDASRNGHLGMVEWLHANRDEGCTVWAMNSAVLAGQWAVAKWVAVNRPECANKW